MNFRLTSEYKPTGDQPQAIDQLARGVLNGVPAQTLLGVTGSGKTFTMANVIERVQRPTLILSHNKTLAAQLYAEMKSFFPDNAVEYFVSYYDYYQPEAYIPSLDKYIEKDLMINDEIDRLRLSTTSALLSGRQDVVVVSSVSCIYGMGNPDDFNSNVVEVKAGMKKSRNAFLRELVQALYSRNEVDFARGSFRVKGDTVDIYLAYEDIAVRVIFWGDEVESVSTFHPSDNVSLGNHDSFKIFPANLFVTSPTRLAAGLSEISVDLGTQAAVFESEGKLLEAQRLRERVTYDIEMMREVGHCPGIENYSRYFDGRQPGMRPFCLLDYFPKDFLTIIDESHVTLPQIRAMYGGDQSRKHNLVNYGFRLQAALDNRPLKFEEFQELTPQTIYVSATPADFELQASEGVVVEQIIRPTGLLDPRIVVRPTMNQIDDLLEEIETRRERNERVLVTTLTKRMAEELHEYMQKLRIKSAYIHSDVDTLDRIRILDDLRAGVYDVLVGVNLLREGLDLPEVSLVAILDADKEGFLRSHRSLTQTVGRAARHLDGMVIMYADTVTESMQQTIDETERRRNLQLAYNAEHGITPAAIVKARLRFIGMDKESADSDVEAAMSHADGSALAEKSKSRSRSGSSPRKATPEDRREERRTTRSTSMYDAEFAGADIAADPLMPYMDAEWMQRHINDLRSQMLEAARQMEFIEAARLRDQILKLEQMLADKQSKQP